MSGKWEGVYEGDDRGSFKVDISENGAISGYVDVGFYIDGTVSEKGDINMSIGEVSSGTVFQGEFKNNKFIGSWKNTEYDLHGTFIANKVIRKSRIDNKGDSGSMGSSIQTEFDK